MQNNLDNKLSSALYIVATPIGNLGDITLRAIEVLKNVDVILAEDTRHSRLLLTKLGVQKPLFALHEHNEREKAENIITQLQNGESIALISDAGTPLISDPGYTLVQAAQQKNIRVIPIPGASALITALSASGLPTDKFSFLGFLPAKASSRRKYLETLKLNTETLIFYEAPHRIIETLEDMSEIFEKERECVLARELTKTFETIKRDTVTNILNWVKNTDQARGEIVLLLAGHKEEVTQSDQQDATRILKILLTELSLKQTVDLTVKITGLRKSELYDEALKLKEEMNNNN
jgi:16S rRNA (cytidine1402-2'-O)-methyltransferase